MEEKSLNTGLRSRHTPYAIRHTLRASRGVTVVLVLAFMGIFALILGTVTSYVLQQGKYGRAIFAREQALHIAEAGLEYYKWWLGRNQNGANLTGPSTVNYAVNDPEGGTLGSALITATPALQCGAVQWIDLESKGTSNSSPNFPRTLLARYMKPSVAEYSYLLNNSVWTTSQILGPFHSNGGIRMEGTHNSNVTSAVSTWYCDGSFGCGGTGNPPVGNKNGVFKGGSGSDSALWTYPVSPVSFLGMVNFPNLQTKAESYGIKLNPQNVKRVGTQQGSTFSSVGANDTKGFHIKFNSNGTVDIYAVTATNGNTIISYNEHDGWRYDYPIIASESLVVNNLSIPSDCSIIFSQAKTWIEGTISGKVTLVVADTGSYVPDIMVNNNISYATTDGTTGLTAVAEGSIQFGLIVPDTLSIRGIFVASGQNTNFGRDYYYPAPGYLPSAYYQYNVRSALNLTGTIVSNQRTGTQWGDGTTVDSGFQTRADSYDRLLAFSPPPFTATTSAEYKLNLWREK